LELDGSLKSSVVNLNDGPLLGIVPVFHIMGLFRFVHLSVYEGRTVVLMPQYDLNQMCQMIQKHKISSMYVVPPMLLHLLNFPQIVDQYDFSTVQAFHVGAAPVSVSLSEAIRQKFNIPVLQVDSFITEKTMFDSY
jgi:acyl-CoA synthetase (AMP-forming)/AMP-acid ligase II